MSRLRPFAYPATPHRRKHGPGGYERYQEYKDWLRDEFTFLILRLKRAFPADGRIERLYAEAFGFPHEMPDLDAKRPEANSRPRGLRNSYFRRRAQGRLAAVY